MANPTGPAPQSDPASERPPRSGQPGEGAGRARPLELIIITGMSGAGRSTAAKVLEDDGWYWVDNLPAGLLETLIDMAGSSEKVRRVAAVVDVRGAALTGDIEGHLAQLRAKGYDARIVYMDATNETLVRRFESVRRPHPLQADGRLLDGIRRERELLGGVRSMADLVIDTSGFNVHQLTAKISEVLSSQRSTRLRFAIMSFGFKYGLPLDGDIVLDMRWLPNPYWIPELRPYNGTQSEIRDFVLGQPGAMEFLDETVGMLRPMVSGYLREGRRYVTLCIGCTGGKHRSVAMAEQLAHRLSNDEISTLLIHRDLGRE